MEKKFQKKNTIKSHIFNKISSIKENKTNYQYRQVVQKLKKFSSKFNGFIDYIQKSIENDIIKTGRFSHKANNRKKSNLLITNIDKYKMNNSLRIFPKTKNPFDVAKKQKIIKDIYKPKMLEFLLGGKNKKKIINYRQNSSLRKGQSNLNNSMILSNTVRKSPNIFKTRNLSGPCSKINDEKNNNSAIYLLNKHNNYKNKNIKNCTIIHPESATISKSISEYNYKLNKSKKNKSPNNSKNLSISLYKNKQTHFSNYKNQLKPEYLMNFVKKLNKIKQTYENDFEINMSKQTKKLLKIAEDEINMKDPSYHQREIFKNVLYKKKTIKFIRKMRAEKKAKVKCYGPGNINNEIYMREKHANLVRFCDYICNIKDDKFYEYRRFLNEFYPNITKKVFKEKYQIPEKNMVYEQRCNKNQHIIERLLLLMQK